jgi:hypothetical protein
MTISLSVTPGSAAFAALAPARMRAEVKAFIAKLILIALFFMIVSLDA